MLLIRLRIELDTEWNLPRGEPRHNLARLRVPQFYVSIVGGAQELRSLVVESNVAHRLSVPRISLHTPSLAKHLPDLHPCVHTGGEQQVTGFWEQTNRSDSLRVTLPRVNVGLG